MSAFLFSLSSFLPALVAWVLFVCAVMLYAAQGARDSRQKLGEVDSKQKPASAGVSADAKALADKSAGTQETGKEKPNTHLLSLVPHLLFGMLAWIAVWFRVAYAGFLTVTQYHIWSQSAFTRPLLSTPLDPEKSVGIAQQFPWLFDTRLGYFIFYSWGRFWLGAVLSIGVALCFWWFLRILERRNGRFFLPGETDVGLLTALLVGWPNIVIFIPLVFLGVIVVSLVRLLAFRERYTTLGWPFFIAAAVTLIWGSRLVELLNLGVLRV
ncbi:MAG: hypothetical protein Q7S84_04460 [bacterium]|nr:hypothetical protein [bacterium]